MSDFNEDEMNEATYSFKAARAGKDIGKPGKMFSKIAKSAGEKYGSEERGKKVAGAVLAKIRAKHGVKEEVEELDELSRETVGRYSRKAKSIADNEGGKDRSKGRELAGRKRWGGTMSGVEKARVPATEEVEELDECDVLDTSMSDIAPSERGEVYKKTKEKSTAATKPTGEKTHVVAGKTGEAYNTTAATKRNLALESAIRDVMTRSLDTRRIYNESAQIAIVSPEQRSDWMNVEQGKMHVVDYFNKYRTEEEQ